jgi:drug/metabolite transporter (DMT)-like permease
MVLTASSLLFLTALSRMPLAEAAAIAFMAPLFIAVLSGRVLRERVQPRTWIALASDSQACCSSCGPAARSSPG